MCVCVCVYVITCSHTSVLTGTLTETPHHRGAAGPPAHRGSLWLPARWVGGKLQSTGVSS